MKHFYVLFILSFLFVVPQAANAQQLSELSVEEAAPSGPIPVFRDFPDHAVLIIESNLTNLNFDSTVGIVEDKSNPQDGIYRLIIQTWRQTITVSAQGYKQARFSVPQSEAREALYYTVNPVETENSDLVYVRFIVNPDDATLYVNNQEIDYSESVPLESGTKQIRIERDGMRTLDDEIKVDPQNNFYSFEMEEIEQEIVSINTNPDDLTIAIDDIEQNRNQFFLYPGDYIIRLSKQNYKTLETQITVTEGGDNTFTYQLQPFIGQLTLNINPFDAQVLIDKQNYSRQTSVQLAPGRHLLEVSKEGYESYQDQFVLQENQALTKTVELEQLTGELLFGITPSSAEVTLFNESGQMVKQWTGLQKLRDLPVGLYQFNARHPEYEPLSGQLKIEKDKSVMEDYTMKSLSDIELEKRKEEERLENLLAEQRAKAEERKQQEEAETLRQLRELQEQREAERKKQERMQIFKYPAYTSFNFHYSDFALNTSSFKDNVKSVLKLGFAVNTFDTWYTLAYDFSYASITMKDYDGFDGEDPISTIFAFSAGLTFTPTLPLGPFLISGGAGLSITQYMDEIDTYSYYYTTDFYFRGGVVLMPENWGVGFGVTYDQSYDIGISEEYTEFSQTNLSLIIAF